MEPNKKLSEEELEKMRDFIRPGSYPMGSDLDRFTALFGHISALTAEIEARDALIRDALRSPWWNEENDHNKPMFCLWCGCMRGAPHDAGCPITRAQSLGIVAKD